MKSYHVCLTCGASLAGKRGTRGPRKFCDKSCAQGYRNKQRAERSRTATQPPPERGVRFVPLTRGLFAKVDASDFADVSRWNWCASPSGNGLIYVARGRTPEERQATGKHAPVLLHRYLMGEPDEDVDHKNLDPLDNRRENLRKASAQQNGANSRSRVGSSQFKGVSWTRGEWRASIRLHYRTIHLGKFDSEEDAARAYDEAARRLHGEFARVNFPREGERSALHD